MTELILGLAPLDGVTDAPFRSVVASLGAVDYCVTEFIRVSQFPMSPEVVLRKCPEIATDGVAAGSVPVHVQLLGSDPECMARAAELVSSMGAPAIDLNFGCPSKRVNQHEGGACLLQSPMRIGAIVDAVRRAVPSQIPVSAKIRLGWHDDGPCLDVARAIEQGGASWLTVHGRTAAQGYGGLANWKRIGQVCKHVAIPVVANGDITSTESLHLCCEETGCTRFMVGRGIMRCPELFRLLRGLEPCAWTAVRRGEFLYELAHSYLQQGHVEKSALGRLKGLCSFMTQAQPQLKNVFEAIKCLGSIDEIIDTLGDYVGRSDRLGGEDVAIDLGNLS